MALVEAQLQAQAMAVLTAAMAPRAAPANPFVANVMTCTPPGKDKHDNDAGAELSCCAGLVEVETPCRGTDVCIYCQPAELAPKDCPSLAWTCPRPARSCRAARASPRRPTSARHPTTCATFAYRRR